MKWAYHEALVAEKRDYIYECRVGVGSRSEKKKAYKENANEIKAAISEKTAEMKKKAEQEIIEIGAKIKERETEADCFRASYKIAKRQ